MASSPRDYTIEPREAAIDLWATASGRRDRPAVEPGGCDCHRCGTIFVGAEWHKLCGLCAVEVAAVTLPPRALDDAGRCCGRKPHAYKRPRPYAVCLKCSAQYTPEGQQEANWAWSRRGEGFRATYPEHSDYWPLLGNDPRGEKVGRVPPSTPDAELGPGMPPESFPQHEPQS